MKASFLDNMRPAPPPPPKRNDRGDKPLYSCLLAPQTSPPCEAKCHLTCCFSFYGTPQAVLGPFCFL